MKTYGLILAGGKSSRFQGTDKSWILWNSRSLIEHVVSRILPQVDQLLISANSNIEKYEAMGYPTISDETEHSQGPLAGIYAALKYITQRHSTTDEIQLLICPCDMPLVPTNLIDRLSQPLNSNQICVAKDETRIQPLIALVPPTAMDHLKSYLDSGQRKVENWILSSNPNIIDLPEYTENFYNINNQDELNRLGDLTTQPGNDVL